MRTQITDQELINFFNNLKEIIQAQKELNHVLAKRITNLEGWVNSNRAFNRIKLLSALFLTNLIKCIICSLFILYLSLL